MGAIAMAEEGVLNAVQFPGLSINGFVTAPNAGIVFLPLDHYSTRTGPDLNASALLDRLNQ